MRFQNCHCPECGELARGTVEIVPAVSLLSFDEDGEAEYTGETETVGDNQEAVQDKSGRWQLECRNGHQWFSAVAMTD
jgi:hypothetical protein